MKIRLHRGSFEDSMKTMEEIEPTLEAIHAFLTKSRVLGYTPNDEIAVRVYSKEPARGWKAEYVVTLDGSAVAFTDEPISDVTNIVVNRFRIQMPRDAAEFKDLPEIALADRHCVRFRVIPGDVPGLRRGYVELTNLPFIWGDYGIYFNLKADLTLTEGDRKVSDHNVTMEIVEINHERQPLPLDYGVGLAIKFLLEQQVQLAYETTVFNPSVGTAEVQP